MNGACQKQKPGTTRLGCTITGFVFSQLEHPPSQRLHKGHERLLLVFCKPEFEDLVADFDRVLRDCRPGGTPLTFSAKG
jgi:hypothetical protein